MFLSYAREVRFNRTVRRLINDLKSLAEVEVWIDEDKIRTGAKLSEVLSSAIDRADFFVPIVSPGTGRSPWARLEYALAYTGQLKRQDLTIVPVLIGRARAPEYLAPHNAINLAGDYSAGFRLLRGVLGTPRQVPIATFALDETHDGRTVLDIASVVDRRLIEYFAAHPAEIKVMDRRLFEELVAELFSGFGFEVELTRRTRDGGRDVVAIANKEVKLKYLVECKRPDPGHAVGVSAVRALYGVKVDEGASKAVLATTAHFSRDAMLLFERHTWELEPRDFGGVMDWISRYLAGPDG